MNANRKGKVGEREWAEVCREHFGLTDARRSQQYCGTADSQDVVTWPGTHAEVKRVERLNIEDALARAEADCEAHFGVAGDGPLSIPYVAHRRNGTRWIVSVRAENLLDFCQRVLARATQ